MSLKLNKFNLLFFYLYICFEEDRIWPENQGFNIIKY